MLTTCRNECLEQTKTSKSFDKKCKHKSMSNPLRAVCMERTAVSVQEAQQKYGELKGLEVAPGAKVLILVVLTPAARQGAEVRHVPASAERENGDLSALS